jgi:hypothetical protein
MSFGDYAGLPDDAIQEFIQYLTDAIELFDEIKDNTIILEYKNLLINWRDVLASYRDELINLLTSQRGIAIQSESDGEDDSTITEIMFGLRNILERILNDFKVFINKIEQLESEVNLSDSTDDVFRKVIYKDFMIFKNEYFTWLFRTKDSINKFTVATERDWENPLFKSEFKVFIYDINNHLTTIDKYAKYLNLYDLFSDISRLYHQRDILFRIPSNPKISDLITDVINDLTELVNKTDEQIGGNKFK